MTLTTRNCASVSHIRTSRKAAYMSCSQMSAVKLWMERWHYTMTYAGDNAEAPQSRDEKLCIARNSLVPFFPHDAWDAKMGFEMSSSSSRLLAPEQSPFPLHQYQPFNYWLSKGQATGPAFGCISEVSSLAYSMEDRLKIPKTRDIFLALQLDTFILFHFVILLTQLINRCVVNR